MSNQEQPDESTKEKKELIWGYGTGVAAATTPNYGDVVLAEYTQPFNKGDVTYFRPLHQRTVIALEQFPTYLTADAAYDAWYVYEAAARHGEKGQKQEGHWRCRGSPTDPPELWPAKKEFQRPALPSIWSLTTRQMNQLSFPFPIQAAPLRTFARETPRQSDFQVLLYKSLHGSRMTVRRLIECTSAI